MFDVLRVVCSDFPIPHFMLPDDCFGIRYKLQTIHTNTCKKSFSDAVVKMREGIKL